MLLPCISAASTVEKLVLSCTSYVPLILGTITLSATVEEIGNDFSDILENKICLAVLLHPACNMLQSRSSIAVD
jgi:hypothetical protein